MDKLTFYINKVAIDDNSDLSLLDLPVAASVQACSGIARIFSLGGANFGFSFCDKYYLAMNKIVQYNKRKPMPKRANGFISCGGAKF